MDRPAAWIRAPFDLAELATRPAAQAGLLDLGRITRVRVVDIPGDGRALDSADHPIYDPFPSEESAGFDLEALAVLGPAR